MLLKNINLEVKKISEQICGNVINVINDFIMRVKQGKLMWAVILVKVKVSTSLIAVGAVAFRVPLYLGHG